MDHAGIVNSLKTGTPPPGVDRSIDDAVKARYTVLIPTIEKRDGDYVYNGPRCKPENLGWRVAQNFRFKDGLTVENAEKPLPVWQEILAGKHDALLIYTYHDAASAEHWYKYEKDWGQDD